MDTSTILVNSFGVTDISILDEHFIDKIFKENPDMSYMLSNSYIFKH